MARRAVRAGLQALFGAFNAASRPAVHPHLDSAQISLFSLSLSHVCVCVSVSPSLLSLFFSLWFSLSLYLSHLFSLFAPRSHTQVRMYIPTVPHSHQSNDHAGLGAGGCPTSLLPRATCAFFAPRSGSPKGATVRPPRASSGVMMKWFWR